MSKLGFGIILREEKVTLSFLAYFLFTSLLFFAKGIGWYDGQTVFKLIFLAAGVCWAVKMLLTDYSNTELAAIAILLAVSFLAYRYSGDKGILISAMVLVGMKNIDLTKLMKGSFWIWAGSCLTNIILCFAGVTYNNMSERDKFGTKVYSCNLGFVNHSVLHVSYLAFTAIFLLAFKEKKKLRTYIWLMLGNIFLFIYTYSFTGFLGAAVCIILDAFFFYTGENTKLRKLGRCGILCTLPVLLAIALLTPLVQNQKLFDLFNKVLNGRLNFSKLFMESGHFTLFGCRIYELIKEEYFFLDSSYVGALAQYGIITFALFFFIIGLGMYREAKGEYWTEASVTIACLVAGLAEPFLLNTSFKNIALFPIGMLVLNAAKKGIWSPLSRFDREISIRLPERQKAIKGNKVWMICGGAAGMLTFVLCMIAQKLTFLTRFCHEISLKGILTIDGFRGLLTWGIVGAVIVYLAAWIISRGRSSREAKDV